MLQRIWAFALLNDLHNTKVYVAFVKIKSLNTKICVHLIKLYYGMAWCWLKSMEGNMDSQCGIPMVPWGLYHWFLRRWTCIWNNFQVCVCVTFEFELIGSRWLVVFPCYSLFTCFYTTHDSWKSLVKATPSQLPKILGFK